MRNPEKEDEEEDKGGETAKEAETNRKYVLDGLKKQRKILQ